MAEVELLLAKPTVFICRDHAMNPLLDQIAETLLDHGVMIIRGPASKPGTIGEFPPGQYDDFFGATDVAMVSSRWRVPAALLERSTRLRGLVAPTIGVETIDVNSATEVGILIAHGAVPQNYESMAEAAMMLMSNLMYQLRSVERVMTGALQRPVAGETPDLAPEKRTP